MVTTLISVRGDAELEVDPDSATVTVTIPAHSESTAARALPNVSRTVAKLTDELVGLGGRVRAAGQDRAPLSWTQSQINCVPEVSHNQRKGRYENTGRFTARTSIPVEVRQFELLERLIRCLGALELAFSSPQWSVDPDNAGWRAVRRDAVRAAYIQARDFADAVGARLEAVEHIADPGLLGGGRAAESPVPLAAPGLAPGGRSAHPRQADVMDLTPPPRTLRSTVEARFGLTNARLETLDGECQ